MERKKEVPLTTTNEKEREHPVAVSPACSRGRTASSCKQEANATRKHTTERRRRKKVNRQPGRQAGEKDINNTSPSSPRLRFAATACAHATNGRLSAFSRARGHLVSAWPPSASFRGTSSLSQGDAAFPLGNWFFSPRCAFIREGSRRARCGQRGCCRVIYTDIHVRRLHTHTQCSFAEKKKRAIARSRWCPLTHLSRGRSFAARRLSLSRLHAVPMSGSPRKELGEKLIKRKKSKEQTRPKRDQFCFGCNEFEWCLARGIPSPKVAELPLASATSFCDFVFFVEAS